jgi:hypothetical protein
MHGVVLLWRPRPGPKVHIACRQTVFRHGSTQLVLISAQALVSSL